MKKKGFTVVELMATFILIALISTLLIRLTITLKEIYINGDVKTALITKQSTMTDRIYQDFKNEEITAIRSCGINCVKFVYAEKEKELNIDNDENKITYDNYTIKLSNGSYLGKIEFKRYDSEIGSIITINIPIYNRLLKGDFGVHITYQIKEIEFDDEIIFDDSTDDNNTVFNFNYRGSAYEYTVPATGNYKLEVWGAQGGGSQISGNSNLGIGGKGGYSKGTIHLTEGTKLYIYVGGTGVSQTTNDTSTFLATGGFNGGGTSYGSNSNDPAAGGGGATDIRIGTDSLYSRVIVAGGGGGGGEDSEIGGYGGGTTGGYVSGGNYAGTQTSASGGATFGAGAHTAYDGGGGGGGWYGGGAQGGSQTIPTSNSTNDTSGASGGSGYVYTSTTASNYPSGCLLNSDYYLTDAETIAGNVSFASPSGGNETGHIGDGYAKITYDGVLSTNNKNMSIGTIVPNKMVHGVGEPTILTAYSSSYINLNKYVTWTSSDKSIATVNAAGKVTFKKTGTVTITATSRNVDSSKSIELTAEEYTGIPSGTYTAGNTITYAGNNWKVLKDNGDTTTLIYSNSNCYKTGTFGSNTEFAPGNNAYSVVAEEFTNDAAIKNEIIKGGIILDESTNTYARLPKKDEVTFSGISGSCNAWTMTKYNSNNLYYIAYNSSYNNGFSYPIYTGTNSVSRYGGNYWTGQSTSTTTSSFTKSTYYGSYTSSSSTAYITPTSTAARSYSSADKSYTSDEIAYVETSGNTSFNSSQTSTYTDPIEVCNHGTRYYSPGTNYRGFYTLGESNHCNNDYYSMNNYSSSMGFKPVITVREK